MSIIRSDEKSICNFGLVYYRGLSLYMYIQDMLGAFGLIYNATEYLETRALLATGVNVFQVVYSP